LNLLSFLLCLPLFRILIGGKMAKIHTSAAVYMAHSWPMETILLSICLEHEKMLGEILGRLKKTSAN